MALGHHGTLLGRHRSCHDGLGKLKARICLKRDINQNLGQRVEAGFVVHERSREELRQTFERGSR